MNKQDRATSLHKPTGSIRKLRLNFWRATQRLHGNRTRTLVNLWLFFGERQRNTSVDACPDARTLCAITAKGRRRNLSEWAVYRPLLLTDQKNIVRIFLVRLFCSLRWHARDALDLLVDHGGQVNVLDDAVRSGIANMGALR